MSEKTEVRSSFEIGRMCVFCMVLHDPISLDFCVPIDIGIEVVAIPLLFGHSLINALSRSMIQRLDEQCAGVLARNAERQKGS